MTSKKHEDIDASDVKSTADGDFVSEGLFVFDARPVVRNWPARVKFPVAGGGFATHEVRFDFTHTDLEEYQEVVNGIGDFVRDGGQIGTEGDPLMAKVVGWSAIAAQGQGELAYSEQNKGLLLRDGRVRQAVLEALFKMVTGIEEKNSETPPGGGSAQPNRAERRAAESRARKGTA